MSRAREPREDRTPTSAGPPAAGRSARQVADNAASAAKVLERRAASARRVAAAFRQGAEGEVETAAALAGLTSHGWMVLHDRAMPDGGNIDHLLVGPGGVVVVDSKSWTGSVAIDEGILRVDGRNRTAQVSSVAKLADRVGSALGDRGQPTDVRSILVLTQNPPPHGPVGLAAGPVATGVHDLASVVAALPETLRPAAVDAIVTTALAAFPVVDQGAAVDEVVDAREPRPARELFLRASRFLYVEPWSRSGHRRLYLNDMEGEALGHKDLKTGQISVARADQENVVRGVLANAHSGGLSLSSSALPKIPIRVPGGRLMGHLGKLWTSYFIAQHWRRGAKDRLYVTHVVMEQGIFDLGFIDLASGSVHPTSAEPLGKDLQDPLLYLERVAERYPRR